MNDNLSLFGQTGQPPSLDRINLIKGLAAGIGTAFVFGMGGFLLVYDKTRSMGSVLFLLLPFATGFATAVVARRWNIVIASLIIGLIMCSTILLLTRMEGWVCVLMSAPLIAFGLALGAVFGALFRRFVIDKSRSPRVLNLLVLLILPLFLMGANSLEKPARRTTRAETFTSVLVVDAAPEVVWTAIKTMDRVNAHKGFLMRIGLPVPISCRIDKEEVGGTRTCYFESGYIEERITEWEPPHSMKLEITSWDVPGRPWLDFKDASYEIHQENGHTVMTRTSTIISRLLPASYWRACERLGVETEHEYLFAAVRHRINGDY
jgi:hypothetical protein